MPANLQRLTITYLFDPLCGWCYGASPVIQQLGQQTDIQLELAPSGLFAGAGGRVMDAAFADYAWSNDMRIEKLTGQRFTQAYRTQVLGKPGSRFDSSVSTLALTAVALTAPQRELEALKVLQEARYINALDTSSTPVVEKLLRSSGLSAAADRLSAADEELQAANGGRIHKAKGMMQSLGAQGVPTVVITDEKWSRVLPSQALYGSFDGFLAHVAQA